MDKKLVVLFATFLLILPVAIGAIAIPGLPRDDLNIKGIIDSIVSFVWKLFAAFSIIAFMISAFLFLTAQGEPDKLKMAKSSLIWGIVGMVVALAAFSIPLIILNSF